MFSILSVFVLARIFYSLCKSEQIAATKTGNVHLPKHRLEFHSIDTFHC